MADSTGPIGNPARPVSLQRWLSRDLAVMILVISALATAISFFLARGEANQLQDNELKQIAHLYRPGDTATMQYPEHPSNDEEADSQVKVWPQSQWARLGIDRYPDGLQDVQLQGESWHMYKETRPNQRGVAVLQATDLRNELATGSALRTLLPLLLLTPVLIWLTGRTLVRIFGTLHDVTDQINRRPSHDVSPVHMETAIEEIQPFVASINGLLERVDGELQRQKRFIADAAHELRTPLAAVHLQVENLERVSSVEAMHERLPPLYAGLKRMRHLVNQLLTLARNQAAGPLRMEPIDLAQTVRDVAAGLVSLAHEKNIDLGLYAPEAARIMAQPGDMESLVQALLENAIKYTPAGGKVTLELAGVGERWQLSVEDTGPGIPEALLDAVTEPFSRANDAETEGSGLGLAIAQGIAHRYGGQLILRNRAGGGLHASYCHPPIA